MHHNMVSFKHQYNSQLTPKVEIVTHSKMPRMHPATHLGVIDTQLWDDRVYLSKIWFKTKQTNIIILVGFLPSIGLVYKDRPDTNQLWLQT